MEGHGRAESHHTCAVETMRQSNMMARWISWRWNAAHQQEVESNCIMVYQLGGMQPHDRHWRDIWCTCWWSELLEHAMSNLPSTSCRIDSWQTCSVNYASYYLPQSLWHRLNNHHHWYNILLSPLCQLPGISVYQRYITVDSIHQEANSLASTGKYKLALPSSLRPGDFYYLNQPRQERCAVTGKELGWSCIRPVASYLH